MIGVIVMMVLVILRVITMRMAKTKIHMYISDYKKNYKVYHHTIKLSTERHFIYIQNQYIQYNSTI